MPTEITLSKAGNKLALNVSRGGETTGGTGGAGVTDGDKGDVLVAGNTWTVQTVGGATIATQAALAAGLASKADETHGHIIGDISGLQAALDGKQAALVSGSNIKTLNGASLLGSGNIAVSASAAWGGITGTLSTQTDLQAALDAKAAASALTSHTSNTSNPHSVTKAQVGLGAVENTALSTWAGSSAITTVGTITSGTWQGTAIADGRIASAATWNAKQNAITFGTGVLSALGVNVGSAGAPVLYGGACGTLTGNITGNAGTATALATARQINGVPFDGTSNITISAATGPKFLASANSLVIVGDGAAIKPGVDSSGSTYNSYDASGGAWDNTTKTFTAPSAGVYTFVVNVYVAGVTVSGSSAGIYNAYLLYNGLAATGMLYKQAVYNETNSAVQALYLEEDDTVEFFISYTGEDPMLDDMTANILFQLI